MKTGIEKQREIHNLLLKLYLFVCCTETDRFCFVFDIFVCGVRSMFYIEYANHRQCSTHTEHQRNFLKDQCSSSRENYRLSTSQNH